MTENIYRLPQFDTFPAGPVATLTPEWKAAGRVWNLRAGYEGAEVQIFGSEWPGYRAETPEAAQAAADVELAWRLWPRTGEWKHGKVLDLADGARPEVWRCTVRDEHIPLGPLPEED